jgi:integrase
MTPENPVEFLKPLPEVRVERERPPGEALPRIFRAMPAWYRDVFSVIYYYGARPSSIERLKWGHVDFTNNSITFSSKKGWRAQTKYYSVPMLPPMKRVLLRIRKRYPLVGDNMPVFWTNKGTSAKADWISTLGCQVIRSCGYSFDQYAFKHKLADEMREAGVPLDQVGEVFGHADIRSTKRYSNNLPASRMSENLRKVRAGGKWQEKALVGLPPNATEGSRPLLLGGKEG